MFNNYKFNNSLDVAYKELIDIAKNLTNKEENNGANIANLIALLNYFLKEINWVGIYLYDKKTEKLVLSHFNGLPACARLSLNSGVCAYAYNNNEIINVDDVSAFEGHIACDSASKSELVIPIKVNNKCIGVLDIDSPINNRFTIMDEKNLKIFVDEVLSEQY